MATQFNVQKYAPPGPVSAAFIEDRSKIAIIEGPYGSGKTTACFFRLLHRAMRMPVCLDGKIHYRALVLRSTYRKMEKTAIRTWQKWYSKEDGDWQGGQDRPSKHVIDFDVLRRFRDGSLKKVPVIFEIEFAAVGDADAEEFFDGYEVTDIFVNAINTCNEDIMTYGIGRVGRYPAEKDLPAGATYDAALIGDTNAPTVDTWLDRYSYNLPATAKWFRQPGGNEPDAENLQNLKGGRTYYDELYELNKNRPWWCQRMLSNRRGFSRNGKPVYEDFNDAIHIAPEPIPVNRNLPVYIGLDGGLHPAAVMAQWLPSGQRRILKELVPGRVGANEFGRLFAIWIDQNAPPAGVKDIFCDPANFYGSGDDDDDMCWTEIVEGHIDMTMTEADSNALTARLDAVRLPLKYRIDGATPELYISPACKILRQGFNSGYRYAKRKKTDTDSDDTQDFGAEPLKNDYSHPHDALQYVCLGTGGLASLTGGKSRRNGQGRMGRATNGTIKNTTNIFG